MEGVDGVRIGLHVCRGNWSRREEVLLSGDYAPLVPAFASMKVMQYVLEMATPRAGDVAIVGRALGDREIGLGVVNPRTDELESVEEIVERVDRALGGQVRARLGQAAHRTTQSSTEIGAFACEVETESAARPHSRLG